MKKAAPPDRSFVMSLAWLFEHHPAFAGRKTRFKIATILFLTATVGIVSYWSIEFLL